MSVTTRATGKELRSTGKAHLQHLLKEVLGQADDSPIQLALAGYYHSVADLMGMRDEDIAALSFYIAEGI